MLRLLRRMRRREVVMCLICAVFVLGQIYLELLLPDYMSELTLLINTPGTQMSQIWETGIRMLVCVIFSAVLSISCGYLCARAAAGFAHGVRGDLFRHIMGLGQQEMLGFSIPSLITRSGNDITQVQMVIGMGLQAMIKSPVMAVWAIMKILDKSWELSVVTAGFVLGICISVGSIFIIVLPRIRIVQKLTDKINKVTRENLTGINVVHAFNAEEFQNQKFDAVNTKTMKTQLFNQRMFGLMNPLMSLGMTGLSLVIFWLGAALINQIPAADPQGRLVMFSNVVVFSTYATYVVMSFMMLIMIFMLMPAAQVSAERINEVLNTKPAVQEGKTENAKEVGSVEFRNVSFRYPDASEDELSNISFRVEKGQTLAIIGATGSGKTTLISLIARFYDATSGQVLVDGVDVRDYSFDALYNRLGYVTQKAVLFSGTIAENVSFGESREEIGAKDVDRALDLACASEFVEKLEDKTAHLIAQSGRNVSGGQKQRISIARALARKAEILIFDDSFSALDYRTDAALRAGLAKELADSTKVIVAQRISTIRHADKILVLEDGEIVGDGRHEELMMNCPVYREIAMSQLSEAELS